MVGFPAETEEDIRQIAHLAHKIGLLRKDVDNRVANVTAAVSWLVPKPHTPFAWLGQKEKGYFENAKRIILDDGSTHLTRQLLEQKIDGKLATVIYQDKNRGKGTALKAANPAFSAAPLPRFLSW